MGSDSSITFKILKKKSHLQYVWAVSFLAEADLAYQPFYIDNTKGQVLSKLLRKIPTTQLQVNF